MTRSGRKGLRSSASYIRRNNTFPLFPRSSEERAPFQQNLRHLRSFFFSPMSHQAEPSSTNMAAAALRLITICGRRHRVPPWRRVGRCDSHRAAARASPSDRGERRRGTLFGPSPSPRWRSSTSVGGAYPRPLDGQCYHPSIRRMGGVEARRGVRSGDHRRRDHAPHNLA